MPPSPSTSTWRSSRPYGFLHLKLKLDLFMSTIEWHEKISQKVLQLTEVLPDWLRESAKRVEQCTRCRGLHNTRAMFGQRRGQPKGVAR